MLKYIFLFTNVIYSLLDWLYATKQLHLHKITFRLLTCKNYGINEPKCLECGDDEDDELEVDDLTDEELDRLSAQYESEIQDLS